MLTDDTSVIYDLKPKTYLCNSDQKAGKQIGYIAEDVALLNKLFATYNEYNEEGNGVSPVAINYNVINVFVVAEMKKLNEKIKDLTTRIVSLEQANI